MSNDKYRTPEEKLYYEGEKKVDLGDEKKLYPTDQELEEWRKVYRADHPDHAIKAHPMTKLLNMLDGPRLRPIPVYRNRHPYGEEETVKGTGEDEGRG